MALSLLALLLLDAFDSAYGYVYKPSKQTSPAENTLDGVNGWSPKPTAPPAFRGQARYGAMSLHELFKRSSASLQTCGWFDGDANQPLKCSPGSACAYIPTPAPQWFSCCATSSNGYVDWSSCPYFSTCYEYNSYSEPYTWSGSGEYAPSGSFSFYCPSVLPYCNTIALTATDYSTYQVLYCAATKSIYNVYQVIASSPPSSSRDTLPESQPTIIVTVTTPRSYGTTTTSSSLTNGPGSSTSSTASPTHGGVHSSSNTGAIVGGVVGGVAGIAVLGAVIGYLVYRKKKQRLEPMREVSIYSNNYSEPEYSNNGYSHPPTTYSGHYSQNY